MFSTPLLISELTYLTSSSPSQNTFIPNSSSLSNINNQKEEKDQQESKEHDLNKNEEDLTNCSIERQKSEKWCHICLEDFNSHFHLFSPHYSTTNLQTSSISENEIIPSENQETNIEETSNLENLPSYQSHNHQHILFVHLSKKYSNDQICEKISSSIHPSFLSSPTSLGHISCSIALKLFNSDSYEDFILQQILQSIIEN